MHTVGVCQGDRLFAHELLSYLLYLCHEKILVGAIGTGHHNDRIVGSGGGKIKLQLLLELRFILYQVYFVPYLDVFLRKYLFRDTDLLKYFDNSISLII